MDIRFHPCIDDIPAQSWNALVRERHPFLQHAFLAAMEHHHCVGRASGWVPQHIGLYDQGCLIGAMPLYEKYNCRGEFVFDHAWAHAYRQAGLDYFPKLVAAIPYTPALGQRLLAQAGREKLVYPLLLQAALEQVQATHASSFHCLFPDFDEQRFWLDTPLLTRHDCQFHWHNPGYSDFDAFLARLNARKRKQILRERRKVAQAGVTFRVLDGHTATAHEWALFAEFYRQTFSEKHGVAVFNEAFFYETACALPEQTVLVLADCQGDCIAGALMYRSETTLFGRYWGCAQALDCLHFETCYYQGIEYCIRNRLQRFEPGAQGEHKVARGFVPTLTRSNHWIAHPAFRRPIREHVAHEQAWVADYIQQLEASLPYKQE